MTGPAADTQPLVTDPLPRRGAGRFATITLLVLGTIATVLAVVAIWANRQALDTDNWTETSTELLENADVRHALAGFLVEQLYANVDVAAQIRRVLPSELDPLAGAAAAGLRDLAVSGANELLSTTQVQDLWAEANRAAHEQLVEILLGNSTTVRISGDTVTLNLGALVSQIGQTLGIDESLLAQIPPGAGQVEVVQSDQVRMAQSVAQGLQGLMWILTILALGLFIIAIAIAAGRRRAMLRNVGFCMVIAGVFVLLLRDIAGSAVVEELSQTAAIEDAADDVWEIGTSLLVTGAHSVILNGVLLIIGAWIAGPTRPAVALRRFVAPYSNGRPAVAYGVAFVVFLLLAWWAPTLALRSPVGLLVLFGLLMLGAEVLRRQMAREFPDQLPFDVRPHVDRVRTGARGVYARASSRLGQRGAEDTLARLERVAALRREGILSEEEAEAQKALILRGTEPL